MSGTMLEPVCIKSDIIRNMTDNKENTGVTLTPAQTVDLLMRLYDARFNYMPDGTVQIDVKVQNLIEELATNAEKSFGHVKDAQGKSVFGEAYEKYRKGQDAILKISDLVVLNPNATASDKQVHIEKILKLSETVTGRLFIQQSIDEFKTVTGVDLSENIKAIQKLSDHK